MDEAYPTHPAPPRDDAAELEVEALFDNVRSVRNVGSMFRTADGAGVRHLHLAGFTPTPAHPKMVKTSLGAERSVPWTHHNDAFGAASALLSRGHLLCALEGGPSSTSLFELPGALSRGNDRTVVLVVGHEVSGIDPRILELCERIVHIPMAGVKGSLNVGVAFGVAVYLLRHRTN